jgi:CRP-like cAMP-binding protein
VVASRQSLAEENRLLAALPRREYGRLSPALEDITAGTGQVLYEAGKPLRHVYFPGRAVLSLLLPLEDLEAEVATVGREGLVGLSVFFGGDRSPRKVICQVPGSLRCIWAGEFVAAARRGSRLHDLVQRYAQARLHQVAQSAACNALHPVEARLCRWLLMAHDRVCDDQLPLTQEFLALMLGVRRPTVTAAAGVLQRAGLIIHGRGRLVIRDRRRLEASSCGCYRAVRAEFERLLGSATSGRAASTRASPSARGRRRGCGSTGPS